MTDQLKMIFEKVKVWGLPGIISYFKREAANFINKRRLLALAQKSKAKDPVKGMTIIADLTAQVSLSKTMRDFVLNLKAAGIPCQTYDTCLKSQIPSEDTLQVLTPAKEFDIGRYSHIVMMYRSALPSDVLPQCHRIRIAFHDSEHGIHQTAPYLGESGDGIAAA